MEKSSSLNEYLDIDKKISTRRNTKTLQNRIRIALLGSFTLNGFKEVLNVKCYDIAISASFYIGGYHQYATEVLSKDSNFYNFRPDVTLLFVDTASIFGDIYFDPYKISKKKRMEIMRDNYRKLDSLINNFIKYGSGILVMNNFAVPTYSPMGILEAKEKYGFLEMVRSLNTQVAKFNRHRSVFIFDYDLFVSEIGKKNIVDEALFYLADMKISPDMIPILCEEYMRYIKALKGMAKKCIVLDLDNVLWGGIIGEDGIEGIKLGPTAPGNAYMEFQKSILALFHKGVILAINSNNNKGDVMKVLKKHPYMILKECHFASLKINWENKVENLVNIAKEINIGLDSIIFLDDSKETREIVKEALPEVMCPDLPEDASQYVGFLRNIKDLDTLQITEEDKKRGKLYVSERKRKENKDTFKDISRYLHHLDIVTEVKPADKFSIPRLSQLTLRTNQFNFSTKRYNESDIEKMVEDRRYDVYRIGVKDKYGDYGISGALIIQKDDREWFIDTFLLSCRILGRTIEDAVLSAIIEKAVCLNVDRVKIDYRRTEKNEPVARFLKQHGIHTDKRKPALILYEKGKKMKFNNHFKHIEVISK